MILKKYLTSPYFYLIAALVGFFGFTQLGDLDLGFHMAQGKYFFEHGWQLPKTEIFSYTMDGRENIIISWLFDVLFYGAYLLGGLWILSLWKSVLLALIVMLFILRVDDYLDGLNKKANEWFIYASALFFIMAIFDWADIERPHVLGYVFLSLFMLIFGFFFRSPKKWHWIALGIVQILWTNTHTSFASGIAFTGIFLFGLWIEVRRNKRNEKAEDVLKEDARNLKNVFFLFLLQIAVSVINPYSVYVFLNVIKASLSPNYYLIQEIWAVDFGDILSVKGLFLFLAIIPIMKFWKEKNWKMLLTILAFMIMGLRAGRLFYDFIVFSAPFTIGEILQSGGGRFFSKKAETGIIITMILAVVFFYRMEGELYGKYGININELPVKTAEFILKENLNGPMYNSYGAGGYLIWKLYPEYQVYIDGRAPVYDQGEKSVLLEYYDILKKPDFWKKIADERGFNFAVVDWPFVVGERMTNRTEDNFTEDMWAPVFFDAKSILYLRRNETNKALIDELEYKYIKPQKMDPSYFQEYLKEPEKWQAARNEFERALKENPENYRTYFMYAAFLAQDRNGDSGEIIRQLQKSINMNPQFQQAKDNLNMMYLGTK